MRRIFVHEPGLGDIRYYILLCDRPAVLYVNLCASESNIIYLFQ